MALIERRIGAAQVLEFGAYVFEKKLIIRSKEPSHV